MNQNQKDKLIDCIKHGAQLAEHYFCNNSTDCCVVGSLARAAQLDDELIALVLEYNNSSFVGHDDETMNKMVQAICDKFGIDIMQLKRLQQINDGTPELEERRAELITHVNLWKVEDLRTAKGEEPAAAH